MPKGGARNRSGPQPDPRSERSELRGLSFRLLPCAGFSGRVPRFPLPDVTDREKVVWRELWRTPQAAMWWIERSWRLAVVARYCRLSVRAEDPGCPPSVYTPLLRLADQLGLTPAGMKENGWRVAVDEVVEKRVEGEAFEVREQAPRRLRAVGG